MSGPLKLTLLLLPVLWVSAASGAVINIDFQRGAGRGAGTEGMWGLVSTVIPSHGPVWNVNENNGSDEALLTSAGEPSGITLSTSMWVGGSRIDPDEADALFNDYVAGDATISGLAPGHSYHIVIYGAANIQNIYRVDQPFTNLSPGIYDQTCGYYVTELPGLEVCDYIHGWAVADAEGEVTVRVHPGAMAGMQIALNPEPSVALLNAIALLGIALRRQRVSRMD